MTEEEIIKKWKDSGILDGLTGTYTGCTELFESEASHIINEEDKVLPIARQVVNKMNKLEKCNKCGHKNEENCNTCPDQGN